MELEQRQLTWDQNPVLAGDGSVVGIVYSKGTEVHYEKLRDNSITPKRILRTLGPLIEKYGFLTTRVLLEDTHEIEWLERFGFSKSWADGTFQYLFMDKLPYQKHVEENRLPRA